MTRDGIMPWRVGRKVGRTIYRQVGLDPSDDDVLIGLMDTPELAAIVVEAVNPKWKHGKSHGYRSGCRCALCLGGATRRGNKRARRMNAQLPAPNNGKQWTGPELEVCFRDDLTIRQAAEKLGRTYFAVRTVRSKGRTDPRFINLLGAA